MIIKPKVKGFICTTAHPVGCAANVQEQIAYAKANPQPAPKRALIIGASTGYGLASRIALAYAGGAATIGVAFERPAAGARTASPGWYNTAAFQESAEKDGLYAKSVIGDAFSQTVKDQVINLIKAHLKQVDMVIYSVAAPTRTTADGTTHRSVLKPVGQPYKSKSANLSKREIVEVSLEPATDEEVEATVKVMGGEDWADWISQMANAGVLADGVVTLAYSYIGPQLTHPLYYNGAIGAAKQDLYRTAEALTEKLRPINGKGYVSINKAVVTQASAAIPVVPLYISLLFRVMKSKNLHEGCIQQMVRMLGKIAASETEGALIRMDDYEMQPEIQQAVLSAWDLPDHQLLDLADIDGYWQEFYGLFGFSRPDVDYDADVDADVEIPNQVQID